MKLSLYVAMLACTVGVTACGGSTKPVWQQSFETTAPIHQALTQNENRQLQRISGNGSEQQTETFAPNGTTLDEQSLAIPDAVTEPARRQDTDDGYLYYNARTVDIAKYDRTMQTQWRYSDTSNGMPALHNGISFDSSNGAAYFWNATRRALVKVDNGQIAAQYTAPAGVTEMRLIRAQGTVFAFAMTDSSSGVGYLMGFDNDLHALLQTGSISDPNGAPLDEGVVYTKNGQLIALDEGGEQRWSVPLHDTSVNVEKIATSANDIEVVSLQGNHLYVESYTGEGNFRWRFDRTEANSHATRRAIDLHHLNSGNVVLSYLLDSEKYNPVSDAKDYTSIYKHVVVDSTGALVRVISQPPSVLTLSLFCGQTGCWHYSKTGPIKLFDIRETENHQIAILSELMRDSYLPAGEGPYRYDLQVY